MAKGRKKLETFLDVAEQLKDRDSKSGIYTFEEIKRDFDGPEGVEVLRRYQAYVDGKARYERMKLRLQGLKTDLQEALDEPFVSWNMISKSQHWYLTFDAKAGVLRYSDSMRNYHTSYRSAVAKSTGEAPASSGITKSRWQGKIPDSVIGSEKPTQKTTQKTTQSSQTGTGAGGSPEGSAEGTLSAADREALDAVLDELPTNLTGNEDACLEAYRGLPNPATKAAFFDEGLDTDEIEPFWSLLEPLHRQAIFPLLSDAVKEAIPQPNV